MAILLYVIYYNNYLYNFAKTLISFNAFEQNIIFSRTRTASSAMGDKCKTFQLLVLVPLLQMAIDVLALLSHWKMLLRLINYM